MLSRPRRGRQLTSLEKHNKENIFSVDNNENIALKEITIFFSKHRRLTVEPVYDFFNV